MSKGTEGLVVWGKVPVSQRSRMRGPRMEGSFEFPVKYGYCCVGEVERAPRDAGVKVGDRVFCLHPHQTRFVVGVGDVAVLPVETPSQRAVLAPNLETAINIVWDARVSAGDRVAVVGALHLCPAKV